MVAAFAVGLALAGIAMVLWKKYAPVSFDDFWRLDEDEYEF